MTERGAIYEKSDYAGIFRRLLVMGIDFTVVIGVLYFAFSALPTLSSNAYFISTLVFSYLYLIEMKRRIGSLGNLITLTRLVSTTGKKPKVISMLIRSTFWFMSWLFTIIDIVWIMGDERKQMVRDKFTGIYVVNRKAKPIAYGETKYSNYMIGGFNFILKEIVESEQGSRCNVG